MIELTRLNKKKFILNCELIETIESTPDTVITLRNGKLLIVSESPEHISQMVLDYKRSQFSELLAGVIGKGALPQNPPSDEGNGIGRNGER